MSIYRKLTRRYLIHNKKRTINTLLGIILSIALITAIGTFLISILQYADDRTKVEFGSYYLKVNDATEQMHKRLQANPQVGKIGLVSNETFYLDDGKEIEIKAMNMEAYSMLPFNPIRSAKQQGLIMENWVAAELKIGKEMAPLTLHNDSGVKSTFPVQSIVENNQSLRENETLQAYVVQKTEPIGLGFDMYVEIAEGVNFEDVYNHMLTYIPREKIDFNYPVMDMELSGNDQDIFDSILYIIPIGIAMIATIAFIFNTFQISITERVRDIALLRIIGATKRQIQKIIVYEMGILGLIGIPIGLIVGYLGFWGVIRFYQFIYEETEFSLFYFPFIISPLVVLLSCLIGVLSLTISGLLPLKLANRTSPLDFVRKANHHRMFKLKGIHAFLKKAVSIETIMALRNIRRNRLKSFTVIFSLSLSIFLFNTFSYGVIMFGGQGEEENSEDLNIIFSQYVHLPPPLWRDINEIPEIKETYIHYVEVPVQSYLPTLHDDQTPTEEADRTKMNGGSLYTSIVPITAENEAFFKERLVAGMMERETLLQNQGVIYLKARNEESMFQIGDKVTIQIEAEENSDEGKLQQVEIVGIVEMDQSKNQFLAYPETISPIYEPTVNRISLYLNDRGDVKKVEEILEQITAHNPNLTIINELENDRNLSSFQVQIQIYLYGFVIAIAFIGVLNIMNTTAMNIILRKKELATLKAIGMSTKALRKMIIREGIFYAVISGVIGTCLAVMIELPLMLSSGSVNWPSSIKLYLSAFITVLIICYLSAKASSRVLENEQWNDALRNE